MDEIKTQNKGKIKLISGFSVFVISLISLLLTIAITYIAGDKILYHNSLKVISIITIATLVFTTAGLFYGIKLKNDFRDVKQKFRFIEISSGDIGDFGGVGEDLFSAIIGAIVLFIISVIASMLLSFFASFVWAAGIILFFIIYWIFYRAIRLILKDARKCKGNLMKSFGRSISYTIIYSIWFYGILFLLNYTEII